MVENKQKQLQKQRQHRLAVLKKQRIIKNKQKLLEKQRRLAQQQRKPRHSGCSSCGGH